MDKIEANTKKIANDIGSFLKKGWGVVSKNTQETASKIKESKFGQTVSIGVDKAAEATKTGFKVGVEKSKVIGTKIAEQAVKAKVVYRLSRNRPSK